MEFDRTQDKNGNWWQWTEKTLYVVKYDSNCESFTDVADAIKFASEDPFNRYIEIKRSINADRVDGMQGYTPCILTPTGKPNYPGLLHAWCIDAQSRPWNWRIKREIDHQAWRKRMSGHWWEELIVDEPAQEEFYKRMDVISTITDFRLEPKDNYPSFPVLKLGVGCPYCKNYIHTIDVKWRKWKCNQCEAEWEVK